MSEAEVAARSTSKVKIEEKWDHSLENLIRKTSIGFAAGFIPALFLARAPVARAGLLALCTGIGSGIAYGEARYLFDHDVMFDKRHLVQLQLVSSPTTSSS